MANIPVERTGGGGWWKWLLALLLLLFLIWLVFELFDEEPDADEIVGAEDNVGLIDDVEIGDDDIEPLTEVDYLYDDYDEAAGRVEIGQEVDLDDVPVLSVVGDSAFFVGDNDGRRVLIVLEDLGESQTGAGGSDGVFDINEGMVLDIEGEVARYTQGERGTWQVPDSERERMLRQGLFVRVNSRNDIEVGG